MEDVKIEMRGRIDLLKRRGASAAAEAKRLQQAADDERSEAERFSEVAAQYEDALAALEALRGTDG